MTYMTSVSEHLVTV